MTVKNRANLREPDILIGYMVDGIKQVPLDAGNTDYMEVQEWIAEGNIPEEAYTQAELGVHTKSVEVGKALEYLKDTDWYTARKIDTGKAIPPDVVAKREAARVTADKT